MTSTFPIFPRTVTTSEQRRCIILQLLLWKLELYKTIIRGLWFENKSNPLESNRNAGLKYFNLLRCVVFRVFFCSWKCSIIITVCNIKLIIVCWKRFLKKNGYALELKLISEANTLVLRHFGGFGNLIAAAHRLLNKDCPVLTRVRWHDRNSFSFNPKECSILRQCSSLL